MDESINEQQLPTNLTFLRQANTHGLINWLEDNTDNEDLCAMIPIVWKILERRIQEHPHELGETSVWHDDKLPIHRVLRAGGDGNPNVLVPPSLLELFIEMHPQGLNVRDFNGMLPLHYAVEYPSVKCFRAVLYNSSPESITIEGENGWTPFRSCLWPDIDLAFCWEMLVRGHDSITVSISHSVEQSVAEAELNYSYRTGRPMNRNEIMNQNAKRVLIKLTKYYEYVLKLPNDATIAAVQSHPACRVVAPKLERGRDHFVLHHALEAHCPLVLVKALMEVFQNQVHQQDDEGRLPLHIALHSGHGASVRIVTDAYPVAMSVPDPVSGLLPIEQALLNVADDGSLENTDAVDALLRADPVFLSRCV